mmetsp:Transcript_12558/g.26577  ORF Transcript_12558/g.26577 Transcript_12558/m.26577 type:complete len:527 (+) Transcript_12558:135-1715(+)
MAMPSFIPRVAAEWVVSHLPGRQEKDWIPDHLATKGIGILSVKELKRVGDLLYSMVAVIGEVSIWERRLPGSARKQKRIDFVRRGFYRDDACSLVNEKLMEDMKKEMETSSPPTRTTTTSAATMRHEASSSSDPTRASNSGANATSSIGTSRKRPNHQISQHIEQHRQQYQQNFPQQYQQRYQHLQQHPQQHQQQQQNTDASSPDRTTVPNAYYNISRFHPPPPLQHHLVYGHGYDNPWDRMAMPPPQPSFDSSAHNTNGQEIHAEHRRPLGHAGSYSSTASTDPDGRPQNPGEAMLLVQLLQMGFHKQEILDGIRHCQHDSEAMPSSDEVMFRLITQREEAEEARREDEVRLISESQKQEESKRRDRNLQDSLSKVTTGEDLLALFPESWILGIAMAANHNGSKDNSSKNKQSNNKNKLVATILRSDFRTDFVEFLKLEEKSRKWYGWKLPAAYFHKVAIRLKGAGDPEDCPSWMGTFLGDERKKLRSGLYELKEQVKGQPKIFLDERPKENGGASQIIVIDDDD